MSFYARSLTFKPFTLLLLIVLSFQPTHAQQLYVASYNIRYMNPDDSVSGDPWWRRCPVVCGQINFESPDIFGAQEVLYPQLLDMLEALDGYNYIGVGREDGKKKGEFAAVFFKTDRLELVDHGHFWLNETPDKPKLGWDAACIRICTWGRFKKKGGNDDGREFCFFNLHMDHVGVVARREAARLVVSKIKELAKDSPVVLTGDFNVDQRNEIYQIFTSSGLLKDTYECARIRFAENGTFNSFKGERWTDSRIDHIFVSPSFKVEAYATLTNSYWSDCRRLPSDHYPVFVKLE